MNIATVHPENLMMAPMPTSDQWSDNQTLNAVDKLSIQNKIEVIPDLTNWNENCRFSIKNGINQVLYYVFLKYDSGCCVRSVCPRKGSFIAHVVNKSNSEVFKVKKEDKCLDFCCCLLCGPLGLICCPNNSIISVEKQGYEVGKLSLKKSAFSAYANINDLNDSTILKVKTETNNIFKSDYIIKGENQIGSINMTSSGQIVPLDRLFLFDPNFSLTASFPIDLTENEKACILGYLINEAFNSCNGSRSYISSSGGGHNSFAGHGRFGHHHHQHFGGLSHFGAHHGRAFGRRGHGFGRR